LYHPDYPTKTTPAAPTQKQLKTWIESKPGFTAYGSLNWEAEYNKWIPTRNSIYEEFETWYNKHKSIKSPFIVIVSYTPGGETIDKLIREYERQGRAVFNLFENAGTPSASTL